MLHVILADEWQAALLFGLSALSVEMRSIYIQVHTRTVCMPSIFSLPARPCWPALLGNPRAGIRRASHTANPSGSTLCQLCIHGRQATPSAGSSETFRTSQPMRGKPPPAAKAGGKLVTLAKKAARQAYSHSPEVGWLCPRGVRSSLPSRVRGKTCQNPAPVN